MGIRGNVSPLRAEPILPPLLTVRSSAITGRKVYALQSSLAWEAKFMAHPGTLRQTLHVMLKVHLHGASAAAALLTARGRLSLRAKARSWLFWLLWSWPLSWRALVEDVEDDRVDEERCLGKERTRHLQYSASLRSLKDPPALPPPASEREALLARGEALPEAFALAI